MLDCFCDKWEISECTTSKEPMENNEQKRAMRCGLVCSVVYLACFFLSFYLFVFVPGLLGNPEMTTNLGLLLIFLSLCAPLSIVVSIGLIWNRYLNQDYKRVYSACYIPPLTVVTVIILLQSVNLLFL